MLPVMFLEFGFLTASFLKVLTGAWVTLVIASIFNNFFLLLMAQGFSCAQPGFFYLWDGCWGVDKVWRRPSDSVWWSFFLLHPVYYRHPLGLSAYSDAMRSLPTHICITCVRTARVPHTTPEKKYLIEKIVGFRDTLQFEEMRRELEA